MKLALIPKPGLRNRLLRMVWGVVWLVLYRPSPIPLHAWRALLLRCFGAKIGGNVHPYPSARIWAPWNLTMDDGSCLGSESDCYNVAPVHIGQDVVVSQKVYLCTASHDLHEPGFRLTGAPIVIEPGAWVAAEAFVGPGVTIGAKAVAGARAVVRRDVAAGDIVIGNPAHSAGTRSQPALDRQ